MTPDPEHSGPGDHPGPGDARGDGARAGARGVCGQPGLRSPHRGTHAYSIGTRSFPSVAEAGDERPPVCAPGRRGLLLSGCVLTQVGPGDKEQLRADLQSCYQATYNQYAPTGSAGVDIAGELLNDAANTAPLDACMDRAGWHRIGANKYERVG